MFVYLLYKPIGYGRISDIVNNNSIMVSDKWLWYPHLVEVPISFGFIFYYVKNYENYSIINIIQLTPFMIHYLY